MEFKSTFAATESGTFAISLVDMPAVRALLRSVSGIHKQNMLSKSFRFITDKLLKLVERPAIELAVELFASSLLNSDLAQIFKSKYSIFRVHNLLGYAMIHISHKPSFPARQTLQFAFGRFGAFGLQLFAKIGITSTPVFDLLRVVKRVIRADCNIYYSPIYSKNFEVGNLCRIIVFQRYMQIENLVSAIIGDCRGFDSPAKIVSVMRWYKETLMTQGSPERMKMAPRSGPFSYQGSFDSASCRSYRGNSMYKVRGDNSLVIPHGREGLSFWKRITFNSFQSFTGAIPSFLYQRRRKIGDALTGKLVGCIMVIDLIPGVVLESPFCGDGERFGVSSHRIEESPAILVTQPKLECYRPKHIIYAGG